LKEFANVFPYAAALLRPVHGFFRLGDHALRDLKSGGRPHEGPFVDGPIKLYHPFRGPLTRSAARAGMARSEAGFVTGDPSDLRESSGDNSRLHSTSEYFCLDSF